MHFATKKANVIVLPVGLVYPAVFCSSTHLMVSAGLCTLKWDNLIPQENDDICIYCIVNNSAGICTILK